MQHLLEWTIGALINRYPLRKNQILGELNHVGRQSVELVFLDKDRPELGAVELIQIQVSLDKASQNMNQPSFRCRVNKLMELSLPSHQRNDHDTVLLFPTTQDAIRWLQTDEYPQLNA